MSLETISLATQIGLTLNTLDGPVCRPNGPEIFRLFQDNYEKKGRALKALGAQSTGWSREFKGPKEFITGIVPGTRFFVRAERELKDLNNQEYNPTSYRFALVEENGKEVASALPLCTTYSSDVLAKENGDNVSLAQLQSAFLLAFDTKFQILEERKCTSVWCSVRSSRNTEFVPVEFPEK